MMEISLEGAAALQLRSSPESSLVRRCSFQTQHQRQPTRHCQNCKTNSSLHFSPRLHGWPEKERAPHRSRSSGGDPKNQKQSRNRPDSSPRHHGRAEDARRRQATVAALRSASPYCRERGPQHHEPAPSGGAWQRRRGTRAARSGCEDLALQRSKLRAKNPAYY
jgi:hypothetical protein